ncbi:uncharacterized protein LOC123713110 [Pieris brassicae]|uniref:uncharacterized protein LOC123713110 n=1 Tax=Pieris brassicae TaxID=7116 RepID=UPI001E660244|nr:uncharacterized protein LOC123713110 [Pieris brassicae]
MKIKVDLFHTPFLIIYVTEECVSFSEENSYLRLLSSFGDLRITIKINTEVGNNDDTRRRCKSLKFILSALYLQPFMKVCANSKLFRRNINSLFELSANKSETSFLKLILEPPDKEILDYAWNERVSYLVWSKIEIENAFAWLSTLGGAYSALGDYFEHCAEEAGRISVRQYRLSQLLGDESLAARSKLYSALAFAQKGNLKLSRQIVRQVAAFARSTNDKRLNRMCQGVWAKLKYLRQLSQNNVRAKV